MKKFLSYILFGTVLLFGPDGTKTGTYFPETNMMILHGKDGTSITTMYPDAGLIHESNPNGSSSMGLMLDNPTEPDELRFKQRLRDIGID